MRPVDWYPLAESDPVPGDPLEVEGLATHLKTIAADIRDQTMLFREIDAGQVWEGDSADKFKEIQQKLPPDLDLVAERYEGVGNALATWATALSGAQAEADQARIDAQDAQGDVDSAESGVTEMDRYAQAGEAWEGPDHHSLLTAASESLSAARSKLALAVAARDEAGSIAAEAIARASDDELNNRGGLLGFWDDVRYSVMEFAEEFVDELNLASQILAIAAAVVGIASIFFPALAPLAFLLGAAALAVDLLLMSVGEKNGGDIALDVISLVTFGAGRAFIYAGRATHLAKAATKASKALDTRVANVVKARAARTLLVTGKDGRLLTGGNLVGRSRRMSNEIRRADRILSRALDKLDEAKAGAAQAESAYARVAKEMPRAGWPTWHNLKAGLDPVRAVTESSWRPMQNAAEFLGNFRGASGQSIFIGTQIEGAGNLVGIGQAVDGVKGLFTRD